MAATDVIREFLVSLGWTHDEISRKKVVDAEQKTTKELEREQKKRAEIEKKRKEFVANAVAGAKQITAATTAMVTGTIAGLEQLAKAFDAMYYSSTRTGSSVKELNAFKYAASQMGSSAEEAGAAVEGLALKIRQSKGFKDLVASFGIDTNHGTVKMLEGMGDAYARMSENQRHAFAAAIGTPEHLLLAMEDMKKFRQFEAEANSKYNVLGFDPQKAAEDGKALMQVFRNLADTLGKIGESAGSKVFASLGTTLKDFNAYLLQHGNEIANALTDIAAAIVKIATAIVEALPEIDNFVKRVGGKDGWTAVMSALGAILLLKVVPGLTSALATMRALVGLAPPAWLLGLLGLTGYAGVKIGDAAKGAFDQGFNAVTPGANTPEQIENQKMGPIERMKRIYRRLTGQGAPLQGNEAIRARGSAAKKAREAATAGSTAGSLTKLTEDAAREAGIDPRIMHGIRAGESGHGTKYDIGDGGSSFGPWQLHYGGINPRMPHAGLGDDFTRDTGLDARDPRTIAAQTRWVAKWLKTHSPVGTWFGYHGNRDANPRWGESGYVPEAPKKVVKLPPMVRLKPGTKLPEFHSTTPVMPGWATGGAALDADATRRLLNAPPLGATNDNRRHVTVNHAAPNISITGVSDPTAAAGMVGARMDKHSSMLLKNMQSAIG